MEWSLLLLPSTRCDSGISHLTKKEEATDINIKTIGTDLAKSVFQIHGVDKGSKMVVRKKLRRSIFCTTTPLLDRHGNLQRRSLLG
jgi:hypothetical protein